MIICINVNRYHNAHALAIDCVIAGPVNHSRQRSLFQLLRLRNLSSFCGSMQIMPVWLQNWCQESKDRQTYEYYGCAQPTMQLRRRRCNKLCGDVDLVDGDAAPLRGLLLLATSLLDADDDRCILWCIVCCECEFILIDVCASTVRSELQLHLIGWHRVE